MSPAFVTDSLAANRKVLQGLFETVPAAVRDWRPAPDKWSFREILAHLLDEERFDFRARLQHVLENPGSPMPPIDPVGWVKEKNYAGLDYDSTLQAWLEERDSSVDYLRQLGAANWKQTHQHPKLGLVTAETFLYNWLAHDYLHIRQLNRYLYEWYRSAVPVKLDYAGDW